MSDKPYYEHNDTRQHLRYWVLGQMMTGAGKAALFVVLIGVVLYAIYLVGLLLPAESKQAPSPSLSVIEAPQASTRIA
jgi:hypothetical protein